MRSDTGTWSVGKFTTHSDIRGNLTALDTTAFNRDIQHFFWISDVPPSAQRAGHGHKNSHQLIFLMVGQVAIDILTPTNERHSITLNAAEWAYIPPNHVITLKNFSTQAIVGVLASEKYDPQDLFVLEK